MLGYVKELGGGEDDQLGDSSTERVQGGMKVDKAVYTVPEIGQLLGISRNQAYEMARQGQIPTIKLGRRLLCPKAAVDRWLSEAGSGREDGQG